MAMSQRSTPGETIPLPQDLQHVGRPGGAARLVLEPIADVLLQRGLWTRQRRMAALELTCK